MCHGTVVELVRKHYGFEDEDQKERERAQYVTNIQEKGMLN